MNTMNFGFGASPHKIFATTLQALKLSYVDVRKGERPGAFRETCDAIDLLGTAAFKADATKLAAELRTALTEALKHLNERFPEGL